MAKKNPIGGYKDFETCVKDQTKKKAKSPGGVCRTIARKAGEMNPSLKSMYETVKHTVTKRSKAKKSIKRLKEASTYVPPKNRRIGNPESKSDWGQAAWEAGRAWTNYAHESGVANARVVQYGFSKWLNSLHPKAIQGSGATKAYLLKSFREGYASAKHKKNPEAESDEMYEVFHGRGPDSTVIFTEDTHVHEHLAGLGKLVGLIFVTSGAKAMEVELSEEDLEGCMLSCSEDGLQLYVNGSVDIDLEKLGYEESAIKDKVNLGEACSIVYRTEKGFDEFRDLDYIHELGKREKSRNDPLINKRIGQRPILVYEPKTGSLNFAGGQYIVAAPGVLN